jgi:hypothetical protein
MTRTQGLTKHYGATVAVNDLSFDVRPGVLTGSRPTPADTSAAPLSERRSRRVDQQPATGQDRLVMARDLRPGDVVQQHDWSLHVREVNVSRAAVAIAVTEFGFALHYAADAQVQLAA